MTSLLHPSTSCGEFVLALPGGWHLCRGRHWIHLHLLWCHGRPGLGKSNRSMDGRLLTLVSPSNEYVEVTTWGSSRIMKRSQTERAPSFDVWRKCGGNDGVIRLAFRLVHRSDSDCFLMFSVCFPRSSFRLHRFAESKQMKKVCLLLLSSSSAWDGGDVVMQGQLGQRDRRESKREREKEKDKEKY